MKKYILLPLLIAAPVFVHAQEAVTYEEHQLTTVLNPWLKTNNAAGLADATYTDHAHASIGVETNGGDYHRAQEGNRVNQFDFAAESYNRLGKNLLAWGSIEFQMGREKERAWSDVIDTYNGSPYIFGSSVKGSYDSQMFDLHIKLARPTTGSVCYGVLADYKVADMSRLRDPRSRTQLADYSLRPSVIVKLGGKSRLGLTAAYRWKKEKMPDVTTVQSDPNILYYTMEGMEFASATTSGYKGFTRQFISTYWGGSVQYDLHSTTDQFLLNLGFMTEDMNIEEDIRHTPGHFDAYHIQCDAYYLHQFENTLLAVDWKSEYHRGSADENLQELVTTRDSVTGISSQQWNTLYTYDDRYRVLHYSTVLDASVRQHGRDRKDYGWLVGLKGGINGVQQAYRMPTSTNDVMMGKVGAYGSCRLFRKDASNLRVCGHVNYGFNLTNDLKLASTSLVTPSLSASSFENGTYQYANHVLLADKNYFAASCVDWGVEVQYHFPLRIKGSAMNTYVSAYYNNIHANQSMGSWSGGGATFGIIL